MTPVSPASDALVRLVRRCRRRLALIAFIRYGCIAVAAAVALSAAVSALLPGHSLTPRGIGMASLLGCAVAAALAGLRAPTLAATGAELDRRLNLSDAVVAALQFRESSEPIAALVVQAAAARVSGVVPARVFPVRPGHSVMIAAAVVIAALALSSFRDSATDVASSSNGPSDSSSTASGGRLEGRESSSRGDAGRGGTLRAAPATARSSSLEPVGERSGGDRTRARNATDEAGSAAPAERATTATPTIDAPVPEPSTPRRNNGDTPSRGTSASNVAGSASPDRRSGRGSAAASSADVRAQGGPGASSEGSTTTTAAGGVQRGRLSPDSDRLEQAATGSGSTSSDGAARAGTEAALSRDEVPPHLRPYVRAYFEAIRARERK
jgi:hypothetical protein